MDETQTTIIELISVLCRMVGVSAEATNVRAGSISMILTIEHIESLGPIVYAANGANVSLDIWTKAPRNPLYERANPAHLRYRITSDSSGDNPNYALEAIQFFGVFLIWYQHGIGSIAEAEANRLLAMWHGRLVDT